MAFFVDNIMKSQKNSSAKILYTFYIFAW